MSSAGERRVQDGEHEVLVLGGGPAGGAASILLAKRGHDVALVRPLTPPAAALGQSIPPSAGRLLDTLDVVNQLERNGAQENGGHTVWWAGSDARVEDFEHGRKGFHVDRAGLERSMSASARAVGVKVYDVPARGAVESESGWSVRCRTDTGSEVQLEAPWLLDATGRTGLLARKEGRRPDRATTTLAIVQRWRRNGGFAGVDPTHTLVESYQDGWAWSVPLETEVRCFTAMVDQRYVDLSALDLEAALHAELSKARHVGDARLGAEPEGPAWACPASLYTASQFGRSGLLLVGDAGSFIDPLSSFGVKKALSSGWLAAAVAHTSLVDPHMGASALAFFDERERDVYRRYRARSATFFEECSQEYGHEYWTSRAEAARAAAGGAEVGSEDPDLLDEAGVPPGEAREALERIRSLPHLVARPGATLRTVDRPTVRGDRIVLAKHLASDRAPRGLRYVRNVDLERLVEVAPLHGEVPDGWAAYNALAPSVPLPDYLAALATAFAAGLLEHSDPN